MSLGHGGGHSQLSARAANAMISSAMMQLGDVLTRREDVPKAQVCSADVCGSQLAPSVPLACRRALKCKPG